MTAVTDSVESRPKNGGDRSPERVPITTRGLLGSGWSKGGGLLVAAAVLVAVVVCSLALGAKLGAVQSGAWASMDYSMAVALNTPNARSLTWVVDQIRPALEAAAG